MAEVSVIVPVYKVEPYLRRCVDSILAQTYGDFELILVDDGSPDRCGEICDEYARLDGRVNVIHQTNSGLSAARNAGLDWMFSHSNSRYVAFIDSDDWIAPNYLEELRKGCRLCDIACVEPQEVKEDEAVSAVSGEVIWDTMPPEIYWKFRKLPMTAWGKMFKRELLEGVRFPVGKIHEDEYVIPGLLFACKRVATSDAKLYIYLRRGDSIMGKRYDERRLAVIDALRDQVEMFERKGFSSLAKGAKMALCGHYYRAITLLGRGEYRLALKSLLQELQLPTCIYSYLYQCAYPIRARLLLPISRAIDVIVRRGIFGIGKRLLARMMA